MVSRNAGFKTLNISSINTNVFTAKEEVSNLYSNVLGVFLIAFVSSPNIYASNVVTTRPTNISYLYISGNVEAKDVTLVV